MTVGELVRVARGVSTGNKALYTMTRAEAKERGLEAFVKPLLGGARELPEEGKAVVHDHADRMVVLMASRRDVDQHPALAAYLGNAEPKFSQVQPAPIAATYVGIPRFVANPDGLIITNSLYTATPRKNLNAKEIAALVERLNNAAAKLPKPRFAARYSPRALEALSV